MTNIEDSKNITYYNNGKIKAQKIYNTDGTQTIKTYYKNGATWTEQRFLNEQKQSEKIYYKNGSVYYEYKRNSDGTISEKRNQENGNLWIEDIIYQNGTKKRTHIMPNNHKSITYYNNQHQKIDYKEYDENGKMINKNPEKEEKTQGFLKQLLLKFKRKTR